MANIRSQSLWSMLPILITSVISIFSVPIYFNVLGDQMYAIWFYVGILSGAFGFMDLGIGVAVGRFIGLALGRKDVYAIKEYWATGHVIVLPVVLFFSLAFIVLGWICGPSWFQLPPAEVGALRWAILWSGVSLFFNYYGQMWTILAQVYFDFQYLSIIRSIISLINVLGTVIVAVITKSVVAITCYSALLSLIQFALLFHRGRFVHKQPLEWHHFRWMRLREMLPYTSKTLGQLISGSVLGSIDRLVLGRLAPASEFAGFSVAQNIGTRLSGLSVAVMGPVFHNSNRELGSSDSRGPAKTYLSGFSCLFPWYLLASLGSFFWAPYLIPIWLKHNGLTVAQAFPWIIAALSINALANISTAMMGSINRVGTGLIFQTISSLLSAALVVLGWKLCGLGGASAGFFAARLIWLAQDAYVRQKIGIKFSSYLTQIRVFIRQITLVGGTWLIAVILCIPHSQMAIIGIIVGLVTGLIELRLFYHQEDKG